MCGRFTLKQAAQTLQEMFELSEVPMLPLRYNIAPTQTVAAVRLRADRPVRELVLLRWGMVPSWADDPGIGNRLINARADGIASKPSFRSAFRKRRCLVLADGFYEWQKLDAKRKQPYYFRLNDGRPFAFAGLWESWHREGEEIESCTLITTEANEVV